MDSPDGSRLDAGVSPSRSADGPDLRRPSPPGSRAEQIRAWTNWFGFRRLIGSAIAMVIVCAGAYWLVRTPPPPTEALLPRAATTSSAPSISTAPDLASPPPAVSPPVATTMPAIAVVHVAGAVVSAGLYQIEAGARVGAAITLAGGPTPDADIDVVNLAAVVVDGSRIYVPRVGESVPPEVAPAGSSAAGSSAAGTAPRRAPGSSTSTSPRSMNSTSSPASVRPPRRRSSPSASATVRSSTSTTSIGCPASARPSSRRCAIW